ncbi:MAG: hypothetical protein FWC23_09425 [Chitinispirillia bacterium]|nr:hypothetical protein [Chitinispirillia bacterium]MCL2269388.1 hypothetical protein [Chitinispirillia bacterium]
MDRKKRSIRVRRNIKDSIFRSFFRSRARFRELYNAIKGTNYGPETPMVETTLSNALIMEKVNDVSYLIDGTLVVFVEAQSTINYNMPLRMLMYVGRVMEVLMKSKNIYREKMVEIPDVEFYVIYNGAKPFPKHKKLKLSNMRCAKRKKITPKLELVVDIYNIYGGLNPGLLSRSRSLGSYEELVERYDRHYAVTRDRSEALRRTIDECRALGIQEELIELFAKGMDNMIFTKFNLEDAKEVWQEEAREDGLEEGIKKGVKKGMTEGRKEGMAQGMEKAARAMIAEGIPPATIARITGLSENKIRKL